jgi:eukaryotic-like serine/threonine-protein kinase
MIGQMISHYKILEKLGQGGMGVVYKAEDTKLKRTVACKFLPRGLETHEPERARFLQEAQAAAALNHPNICTIHDISIDDDQQFIIMEYVDGKTMKQMVPVQKIQHVVDYAIQIGEALQEAHSHAIVHRDIKTENIMVNTRNQVKVMDFGLAKLKGSLKLTRASSTVGTLAYMSPEQIQGAEVDSRSDIFSFGVVLYEMLTGALPFHGEYEAAIVYSIVNEEPEPVHKYRPEISSEVMHILNRSLEKNPEERYQTVHEMLIDLRRVKKESAHAPRSIQSRSGVEKQHSPEIENRAGHISEEKIVPAKGRKISKKRLAIMAALLCFLIVMTIILFLKPFSKKPLPPFRIIPFASSPGQEVDPAFSPDGNQIAYLWNKDDQNNLNLYIKLIGAGDPLRLTNSLGDCESPVWSPDGHTVAYLRSSGKESGIYKIPALGGTEQRLLAIDSTNITIGLDWSPDGEFLIFSTKDSVQTRFSIFIFSLSNQKKRQLTFPPKETLGDNSPNISPDGKWIAFLRVFSYGSRDIYIIPFAGGTEKRITSDNKFVGDLAWSPDGREIIFSSNRGGLSSSLWRIPFDGGEPQGVTAVAEDAQWIAIAKKEQRLAYTKVTYQVSSIWRGDIPKNVSQIASAVRLISTNQGTYSGRFSTDGRKIAFMSSISGSPEIWICNNDGSNPIQLTDFKGYLTGSPSWSPDNQNIAFDSRPYGHSDIFITNADGGQMRRLTTEASDDRIPSWSRDGRWIYFTSNRSGSYGIWKLPLDGGDAIQVSKEEGWNIFESQDGKRIYYNDDEEESVPGKIWKLSLENGEKQLVLKDIYFANWVLVADGIYYLKSSPDGNDSYIYFFNFASNNMEKIARIEKKSIGLLDISPDRSSFLGNAIEQNQVDQFDIYLVENFR